MRMRKMKKEKKMRKEIKLKIFKKKIMKFLEIKNSLLMMNHSMSHLLKPLKYQI